MMNYGRYEDGAEYADFSGKSVQIRIVISGQNGVQMKKKTCRRKKFRMYFNIDV